MIATATPAKAITSTAAMPTINPTGTGRSCPATGCHTGAGWTARPCDANPGPGAADAGLGPRPGALPPPVAGSGSWRPHVAQKRSFGVGAGVPQPSHSRAPVVELAVVDTVSSSPAASPRRSRCAAAAVRPGLEARWPRPHMCYCTSGRRSTRCSSREPGRRAPRLPAARQGQPGGGIALERREIARSRKQPRALGAQGLRRMCNRPTVIVAPLSTGL